MAAFYPGSIKTFSTKAPGQAIASSHINELQDEVVAVETQLGVNAGTWQDWTPTLNTGNADLSSYNSARYCQVGKLVFITFKASSVSVSGTSGSIRIGLPVATKVHGTNLNAVVYPIGSTYAKVQCIIRTDSPVMELFKGMFTTDAWAATETGIYIQIEGFYEAA